MGWQDRDYNPSRENMNAYFANPAALLQFAIPIFKSAALDVRLSFWFLLAALFQVISIVQEGLPLYYIPIDIAIMLAALLWHEFGHRVFSRAVGGNHWEWVLWPLGGMVAPTCPRTAKATFIANIGGMAFTLLLSVAIVVTFLLLPSGHMALLPFLRLPIEPQGIASAMPLLLVHVLNLLLTVNFGILTINLFPCYWFDGGYLWQSVLWPFVGQWKAIRITCLAGMILSVPLLMFAIWNQSLLGMVFAALIFADCFNRRRALAAAGPGVLDEDDSPSYNYMDTPVKRRKPKKSWFKSARKKAIRDQAEQARIDAILAKVKERGLHSLTWWEKRTLRKATERQRQRDLAERM
jgi:hypothetical protein